MSKDKILSKPKYINKICKIHGVTNSILQGKTYYRCIKCRTAQAVSSRQKRKQTLVGFFGGKCEVCDYDTCIGSLHFHHLDPKLKSFSLSRKNLSLETTLAEALKCALICSNCHGEVHAGLINLNNYIFDRGELQRKAKLEINKKKQQRKKRELPACRDCKKIITPYAIRCKDCANKTRKKKILWPSIPILEKMVLDNGFSATGRILGVTDNSVRKHIKTYKI